MRSGGPAASHICRMASSQNLGRHCRRGALRHSVNVSAVGLELAYAAYGSIPWIAAVFYGLKPAVMAIVAYAVMRIGKKALKNSVSQIACLVPVFASLCFIEI
jgi:chromate transporter